MSRQPRKARYVKADPLTWARIREEFLDGATAKDLAARYGVAANTIYNRSSQEGWTKAANPRPAPPETVTDVCETPREAALAAADQAARELAARRPSSAAEFARLAEVLARVAERLEATDGCERDSAREEGLEALKARVAELRRRHEESEATTQ